MSIVKARKEWECVYCGRPIKVGQLHEHGRTRAGRYSIDDAGYEEQIGIEYVEWRLCLNGDMNCKEADNN